MKSHPRSHRRFCLLPVVLLLSPLLPGAAVAADFEGTEWQLDRYRTDAGLVDAAEGGTRAVLRFEDGRVSGSAGCNRLMGGYSLDGDTLRFEPNMASTMMACPPPLMEQEQAVVQALGAAATLELDAGGLTLVDDAGKPLLMFTELAAQPLTNASWRLTNYNNGKGAVVSTVSGTEIVLLLGDDGQLSGKACNTYRGGYRAENGDFTLDGPLAATRMACSGPEGVGEQESAYFAALERVSAYRIKGDELVLTDADGATLARFRAAEPGE